MFSVMSISLNICATTRRKFLPSRLGNCQQNFSNGNVDKARMNFPFWFDSNISPFLTSHSGISCAYFSKAQASRGKN